MATSTVSSIEQQLEKQMQEQDVDLTSFAQAYENVLMKHSDEMMKVPVPDEIQGHADILESVRRKVCALTGKDYSAVFGGSPAAVATVPLPPEDATAPTPAPALSPADVKEPWWKPWFSPRPANES